LSGGDPFLRVDIWAFLVEIQKRNLGANIITNGTSLNEETAARLTDFEGLKLYVSYHRPNKALRGKIHYAVNRGISTHGHVVLDIGAYRKIDQIFDDLHPVESVMLLYPTNTGGNSRVRMWNAGDWQSIIKKTLEIAQPHPFDVYYEPAFARRDMPGLEEVICHAGKDPFIHVDGKSYPCCLLVDTEYGINGTFNPQPFDYRQCPVLNVGQPIENKDFRRICPLVFTDAKEQKYVFPSRIEEVKHG
jgi:MoaA/NifB/PqqE/SkfB family radical SAM enzyme